MLTEPDLPQEQPAYW